jgi:hypothetical protein
MRDVRQATAKREMKDEQQLQNPDQDRIRELQSELDEAKSDIAGLKNTADTVGGASRGATGTGTSSGGTRSGGSGPYRPDRSYDDSGGATVRRGGGGGSSGGGSSGGGGSGSPSQGSARGSGSSTRGSRGNREGETRLLAQRPSPGLSRLTAR